MTTFASAVRASNTKPTKARTTNGMATLPHSNDPVVDLFYNVGALRGRDAVPYFRAAFAVDQDMAVRIALWARDVRSGAGERKIFRDILVSLANTDPSVARRVLARVPELGRWDDVLVLLGTLLHFDVVELINSALRRGDGLVAKWMPRKGPVAAQLRYNLGLSPRSYRKTLVNLTKVVESQMCARDWDNINFSHVPSVASARYKKAFARHTENYKKWAEKLESGDATVKVNAGAVYPYDVIKGLAEDAIRGYGSSRLDNTRAAVVKAQWAALPNYVGDSKILPIVDVSGSMLAPKLGKSTLAPLDVSVSLGLYVADKNLGAFKDTFLTFSSEPELVVLKGSIIDKIVQMSTSKWEMSTNLHAAFEKILSVAKAGRVPQSEMPETLLIFSDMQFNECTRYDDSAMKMITRKYDAADYTMPKVVFWNLNSSDNTPVRFDDHGVALVSGFSPSILKSILANDLEQFTPKSVMLKTIMSERYDY